MIQVCDPPRQRQVRRLSAEEFFTLVRCGGAGFYRPCSEVLRMLTAGEAWGTAGAALLVLPLTADTAAAAALRSWLGRRQLEGGCLLTPPVNTGEELPARLVEYLKTGPLRLEFPDQEWVKWAELYSFMDVQEMTWKRKKLLSLMVQMDHYSDYLLLWSPRDKKLWYLDIEHEEFHSLAKWDDFIADPGRYLNGMIEGEFEK